jgi:hypothetical protein
VLELGDGRSLLRCRFGDRSRYGGVGAAVERGTILRFAIADVRRAVPGVSDNTIRLVLSALKNDSRITNDGTGRNATRRRT